MKKMEKQVFCSRLTLSIKRKYQQINELYLLVISGNILNSQQFSFRKFTKSSRKRGMRLKSIEREGKPHWQSLYLPTGKLQVHLCWIPEEWIVIIPKLPLSLFV